MSREKPVLIGYAQVLDAYSYTDDGVPMERKPLRPGEVWLDYDAIPATPPVPSPWPGTSDGVTVGVLDEPLVATADPRRFTTDPPARLGLLLPGNMRGAAYRARLRDTAGREIPYDPSVWVADGLELVVAFKTAPPSSQLRITYWAYAGRIVGDVPVAGVENEGAGPGAVYDAVVDRVARLRTLEGGSGISVTTGAETIHVADTASVQNLGAGAGIFAQRAGTTFELRSIVAGTDAVVTQTGTEVVVGNAVTGANLGTGAAVFAGKSGGDLQMNTLADAGDGISISTDNGIVLLSSTLTGANVGGGEGELFIQRNSNGTLSFRALTGTNGISIGNAVSGARPINISYSASSLGGTSLVSSSVLPTFSFRTIRTLSTGDSGMTISQDALDVYFAMATNVWFVRGVSTQGVAGGSSSSGSTHVRTLNTISSASQNAFNVTLTGNNLSFRSSARFFVFGGAANRAGDGNFVGLYNNTTASFVIRGSPVVNAGADATSPATFSGVLTSPSAPYYSIRHYITTGRASDGLGAATNQPGRSEIYTWLTIIQLGTTL
ncbi:MAG: hypothetical protein WC700_04300 [Gemmatimonadaceae bacterium]|jgi:hypothetical protein